mmetsp:Transcript_30687/g.40818  ORF Transcript_30687/g.40818 Transcript_30687/m.40818 type:complete len:95 (-) Transcript_30687:261-545(-)
MPKKPLDLFDHLMNKHKHKQQQLKDKQALDHASPTKTVLLTGETSTQQQQPSTALSRPAKNLSLIEIANSIDKRYKRYFDHDSSTNDDKFFGAD